MNQSRSPRPSHPPRQTAGGIWLWGTHPVLAALANPERQCRRLLVTAEILAQHRERFAALVRDRKVAPVETVERRHIDSLLPAGSVHQGIALLAAPLEPPPLSELLFAAPEHPNGILLVLDQVTDPHNLGAMLRSAASFGAMAVVTTERHASPESGTLAKAASGALEAIPLVRETNLARALDDIKEAGFWVAGLDASAPGTLAAAKLTGRVALVLGSEGGGLRRLTREKCDLLVSLPSTGLVESLNVSNAAAVALYELTRK